jgi:hypothetical protein
MLRFIDLGKQIAQDHNDPKWSREFAFYDTLEASFLSFGGQQVFDSYDDIMDKMDDYEKAYVKRIVALIPAWVPRDKGKMSR